MHRATIVAAAAAALLAAASRSPQEMRTVRGRVVDSADGRPLAGASVVPSAGGPAVVTGAVGTFQLAVPAADPRIHAVRLGYAPARAAQGRGGVSPRLAPVPDAAAPCALPRAASACGR